MFHENKITVSILEMSYILTLAMLMAGTLTLTWV